MICGLLFFPVIENKVKSTYYQSYWLRVNLPAMLQQMTGNMKGRWVKPQHIICTRIHCKCMRAKSTFDLKGMWEAEHLSFDLSILSHYIQFPQQWTEGSTSVAAFPNSLALTGRCCWGSECTSSDAISFTVSRDFLPSFRAGSEWCSCVNFYKQSSHSLEKSVTFCVLQNQITC